jgi:protein SMG6
MERCLDPMLPASIHTIPQKYNLPNRLWKIAFQLLFERFRAALAVKPTEPTASSKLSAGVASDLSNSALDHLIDFSYYAYTFYTQLLEQQSLTTYRATWIEQLGDIALYRMEAAKLAGSLASSNSLMSPVSPTAGTSLKDLLDRVDGQELSHHDGNGADKQEAVKKQLVSRKDRKKGFPGMAKLGDELEVADPPGNSIGIAALDDWELAEVDIWQTVARDWYFLGLNETPGTGRLHYHLASISEGDELRTLFHLTKW